MCRLERQCLHPSRFLPCDNTNRRTLNKVVKITNNHIALVANGILDGRQQDRIRRILIVATTPATSCFSRLCWADSVCPLASEPTHASNLPWTSSTEIFSTILISLRVFLFVFGVKPVWLGCGRRNVPIAQLRIKLLRICMRDSESEKYNFIRIIKIVEIAYKKAGSFDPAVHE